MAAVCRAAWGGDRQSRFRDVVVSTGTWPSGPMASTQWAMVEKASRAALAANRPQGQMGQTRPLLEIASSPACLES